MLGRYYSNCFIHINLCNHHKPTRQPILLSLFSNEKTQKSLSKLLQIIQLAGDEARIGILTFPNFVLYPLMPKYYLQNSVVIMSTPMN